MAGINKFKPIVCDDKEAKNDTKTDSRIDSKSDDGSSSGSKTPKPLKSNLITSVDSNYFTTLYNGEKISKTDKIICAIGSIEELISYFGIIKSEHYTTETDAKAELNSTKLFSYARFTKIQEILYDIILSISTTKKVVVRYDNSRFAINSDNYISELEQEMTKMGINPKLYLFNIAGMSVLESKLMYARSLCRRIERQLAMIKSNSYNIVPEDQCLQYINKLGDYILALSVYNLSSYCKEPMKYNKNKK